MSLFKLSIAALMLSSLVGCQHTEDPYIEAEVNHSGEAGTLLVSVNAAVPWTAIESQLSPNFKMENGGAAMDKVIQSTAHIDSQIVKAFGAGLAVGFAKTTKTSKDTSSETTTDGVTTTTISKDSSKERNPGVAPTVPGPYSSPNTGAASKEETGSEENGGNSEGKAGIPGVDAQTQYRAARSLYQTVKLLNSEIEHVALKDGYVPQVLMLKLTNIVYQRNVPYDTHATVSFFRSANDEKVPFGKLPYVFPILATDNLERAIVNNSAQLSSQLGFALDAMVNNIGLGANFQNQSSRLNAISANEINSLMTVGRMTDNSIYVRIGAANQATSRYSMVGQTYDVAVLVLVPKEYYQAGTEVRLDVVSHHKYVNAKSGRELSSIPYEKFTKKLDDMLQRVTGLALKETWRMKSDLKKLNSLRKVHESFSNNTFSDIFNKQANSLLNECCIGPNKSSDFSYETIQRLWTQLVKLKVNASTKIASVEISKMPLLDVPQQGAVLRDFGDDGARIILHGVSGVRKNNVNPLLEFCSNEIPQDQKAQLSIAKQNEVDCESIDFSLPPSRYSYERATGLLTLSFPPLKPFGLNYKSALLRFPSQKCEYTNVCKSEETDELNLGVYYLPSKSIVPEPQFALRQILKHIVADKAKGSTSIFLEKLKDKTVEISVSGGRITNATTNLNDPATKLPVTNGKLILIANTPVHLEFDNLRKDHKVTIKAEGKNEKGESTGVKNVEFSVEVASED